MIYLNGKIVEEVNCIASQDRGFLLGDGLFETVKIFQGSALWLDAHLERLKKGAKLLCIPCNLSLTEWRDIIQELCQVNKLSKTDAVSRLTLTRGPGLRGLLPSESTHPTLMITAQAYPLSLNSVDFKIHIANKTRRNQYSPLANIKSLNYLDNILARIEAKAHQADEAVVLNTQDDVAGASAANLFCVDKTGVSTPRLIDGALPGVMRQVLLQQAGKIGINIEEKSISLPDLLNKDEIFLTNSLIGIQSVSQINDRKLSQQSIALQLRHIILG